MRLGTLTDQVAVNCGPNPCGFMDALWSGAECNNWQTCAANQSSIPETVSYGGGPCVVGGTNEYGDTIVNCPSAMPCLRGSGPLQPGQAYCPGVIEGEQAASNEYFGGGSASNPPWMILGIVALGLAIVVGLRK